MESAEKYVRVDEYGVMRVAKTRVMLDSVVIAFQQGHSAETIQQQYPSLSLEEVYGAVAHYLAHRDEIDRYLKRQGEVWDDWRDRAGRDANPVVQRLRSQIVNTKSQTP